MTTFELPTKTMTIKGVTFDTWHGYYSCPWCHFPESERPFSRANNPFGGILHFSGEYLYLNTTPEWKHSHTGLRLTRLIERQYCTDPHRRDWLHEIWDWEPA